MSLCPRCSAIYDGDAAKIYQKRKLERKIAEKETEKDPLRRKLTGKQKKFDFGPFDRNFMKVEAGPAKQQMKIVVMVEGKPDGVTSKIRFTSSKVTDNQWIQNGRHDKPGPSRRRNIRRRKNKIQYKEENHQECKIS